MKNKLRYALRIVKFFIYLFYADKHCAKLMSKKYLKINVGKSRIILYLVLHERKQQQVGKGVCRYVQGNIQDQEGEQAAEAGNCADRNGGIDRGS
jgi:hypothetical protein